MPEVFNKNCKVTIIEYGTRQDMSFKQLKTQISAFFRKIFPK
jgi:hypothetical protein